MNKSFLCLLFFILSVPSYSQTFIQSDFNRLINNHPLMKNYDKNTGFFKNTAYDIIDLNKYKAESASLSAELEKIILEKKEYSQKVFFNDSDNEDYWKKISDLDKRIEEIEKQIDNNNFIIDSNGNPNKNELIKIVDAITDDILVPLFDKNHIVLNKLPVMNIKPNNGNNDLRRFFYNQNEECINNYLDYSYPIKSMFNGSNDLILYKDDTCSSNKIFKIDLAKVLALHPKMSMFDFNRFGFYKINTYNLSEKDFNDKILEFKKTYKSDYSGVNHIEKELKDIKSELRKQIVLSRRTKDDNSKIIEELQKKEKLLLKKKDKLNFNIVNNEITDIEETKTILKEIEEEINSFIYEFAKKENVEIIFDSSLPNIKLYSEFLTLTQRSISNNFNYNVIYYIIKEKAASFMENYNLSNDFIEWLILIKNPRALVRAIDDNPPIIIYGGDSIDKLIINELYKKYKIEDKILEKIISMF